MKTNESMIKPWSVGWCRQIDNCLQLEVCQAPTAKTKLPHVMEVSVEDVGEAEEKTLIDGYQPIETTIIGPAKRVATEVEAPLKLTTEIVLGIQTRSHATSAEGA